jgi:hypothetical protein
MDQRKVHPGLFEYGALTQYTCAPTAATLAGPCIFNKPGLAIDLFDGLANAVLQLT